MAILFIESSYYIADVIKSSILLLHNKDVKSLILASDGFLPFAIDSCGSCCRTDRIRPATESRNRARQTGTEIPTSNRQHLKETA